MTVKSIGAIIVASVGVLWTLNAHCQEVESEADLPPKSAAATLTIETKVGDGRWRKRRAISPLAAESVALRLSPIEGGTVRWFLVFPDLSKIYANANPPWSEVDPYKWVGVQRIDTYRVELTAHRGQWEIEPFAGEVDIWKPVRKWLEANGHSDASRYYLSTAGTFRFQALVDKGNAVLRTPGLEEVGDKGISNKVLRVSRRSGAGFLGQLSAFYNVPGVFGSVVHQSSNYVGVDCADVLVAALSKFKRRPNKTNYNVDMLVGKLKRVAQTDLAAGVASEVLTWGTDFRAGDFIAVKYEGASRYQHIGALSSDADGDGVLGPGDLVTHAGPYPLHTAPLRTGAFDGHVVLLRPR